MVGNLEDTEGNDDQVFFLNVVPSAAVPVPGLGPVALGVLAAALLVLARRGAGGAAPRISRRGC